MTPRQPSSILVVSHLCPFPPVHGNRSRFLALLRWLREQGFRITFVLQPLDVDDRVGLVQLAQLVDRLDIVHAQPTGVRIHQAVRRISGRIARLLLPREVTQLLAQIFRRRTQVEPHQPERSGTGDISGEGHIDAWCWQTTSVAVARAVRRDRPIAVVLEYALLSKCLDDIPASILKIIDTVELFFRNTERFEIEGLKAPVVCSADSEKLALARADVLVAIQRNDAEALRTLFPEKQVITVSHAYRHVRRPVSGPRRGTILYVGSPNPFNVHGLRLFIEQAWETILRRVPAATLRVVGSIPPVPGMNIPQITYVGRVTNNQLATEYEMAHAVINPQLAGTGLKIKCVEALSSGCPLVVNQAGADGLEHGIGTAFLLAKDWQDFANHVVTILTDDTVRNQLETGARQFAETFFSSDATFSELAPFLAERRPAS